MKRSGKAPLAPVVFFFAGALCLSAGQLLSQETDFRGQVSGELAIPFESGRRVPLRVH